MSRRSWGPTLIFAALAAAGCLRTEATPRVQILAMLPAPANGNADYVVRFQDPAEARLHAAGVRAGGGQVQALDREGRIQHVTATAGQLRGVRVAADTQATANTRVTLRRPEQGGAQEPPSGAADGDAQAFLTARQVTGVEALSARFPDADGRGVKVAVLDTGIDIGIAGVSQAGKLAGFYDFSGFGRVPLTALADPTVRPAYAVGGRTVTFAAGVGPQLVQAVGLLDETALARAYLAGRGIDLDGNGRTTDAFAVLVGVNAEGKAAVWVDVKQTGVIDDRAAEELTDFNTSAKYILMAPGASPSGARPLAVTITSPTEVQFHSVQAGHGTSCAVIIAGDGYANGRLKGMAPKAQLLSYVLDAAGQDVYTLDQFLAMFVSAKEQGADAISSSWGFATADLASARFVSAFLDQEIAAAGIVIGIAAGNDGPGTGSAAADDYLPHLGFGVGAMVSTAQAQNVYGWTGMAGDTVVYYSSFGPTVGGRQVPDAISPISTLVRGNRQPDGPSFYAFSGTSSATPALIGSAAALISALKQHGTGHLDARLLKLAVQSTAHPLPGIGALRQGAGVIDVALAYDRYVQLAGELAAATADAAHRTAFAYELRADTPLPGQTGRGEGVVLPAPAASATVSIQMAAASAALLDPLTFVEPLTVAHAEAFYRAPAVVSLQTSGATVTLQFDLTKLTAPGIYTDVLTFARASDGLVLLRVPVAVTVPGPADAAAALASLNAAFEPFTLWRQPFTLATPSPVDFDGLAQDLGGNANSKVGIMIQARDGHRLVSQTQPLSGAVNPLTLHSPILPAGTYEAIVFRTFGQPAALGSAQIVGTFHLPALAVLAAQVSGTQVQLAAEARQGMTIKSATLALTGRTRAATLSRDLRAARPGFYGDVDLGPDGAAATGLVLGLRQGSVDRGLERFLAMETALVDKASGLPLYRGWIDVEDDGSPLIDAPLSAPAQLLSVVAYPNLTDWASIRTDRVTLLVGVPLATPLTLTQAFAAPATADAGQVVRLAFDLPGGRDVGGAYGELTLSDPNGTVVARLAVSIP